MVAIRILLYTYELMIQQEEKKMARVKCKLHMAEERIQNKDWR